jgi:uncharacterized RDD family membrane protein YckC
MGLDISVDRATAGVVTRLLAGGVDVAVVVLVATVLDLAAAGARFVWSPIDFRWPQPAPAVTVLVLLVVGVGYLAAGWAMGGQTYGARLLGLRVLSSRLELLGWTRSVLRAAVCVVWPVGLLWCGISRRRRSVADLVVRSVVVYDKQSYAQVRGLRPARASGPAAATSTDPHRHGSPALGGPVGAGLPLRPSATWTAPSTTFAASPTASRFTTNGRATSTRVSSVGEHDGPGGEGTLCRAPDGSTVAADAARATSGVVPDSRPGAPALQRPARVMGATARAGSERVTPSGR